MYIYIHTQEYTHTHTHTHTHEHIVHFYRQLHNRDIVLLIFPSACWVSKNKRYILSIRATYQQKLHFNKIYISIRVPRATYQQKLHFNKIYISIRVPRAAY